MDKNSREIRGCFCFYLAHGKSLALLQLPFDLRWT
jgi:hypothetical protein